MSPEDSTQPVDAPAIALPMPGHVFERKYRIRKLIGEGGFAQVYLATFEDVGRDVAIKVLVPDEGPVPYPHELDTRFLREAQLISDLRSPHTVTMFDFGRAESGLLYMVFEYIDGTPLDKMIRDQGALSPDRSVNILRQALLSLREAHAVGILHRDVKPANIMVYDYLEDRDQVKVLDFGVAKQVVAPEGERAPRDLTQDGTLMGTPRYMSPEQICREPIGPPSDIYGLGLVAYEMLTGEQAVADTRDTIIIRSHLGPEPFVLPADVDIPNRLREIVQTMMAKNTEDRYQSANEVLRALEDWAAGEPQYDSTIRERSPSGLNPPVRRSQSSSGVQAPATPQPPAAQTPQQPRAAQTPGSLPVTQAPKPDKTYVSVETTPQQIEVSFPPNPNKQWMMFSGIAALAFVFALFIFGFGVIMIIALLALAFCLSRVFRSAVLTIDRQTGYELTISFFGIDALDREQRGPVSEVVRATATGSDEDENAALVLSTHSGDVTLASSFREDENEWVAAQINAWLESHRRLTGPPKMAQDV